MKPLFIYSIFALGLLINFVAQTIAWIIGIPRDFYEAHKTGFRGFLSALPEPIREKLPWYDSNGLRHNLLYLHQISLKEMVKWPLEKQAEFADIVTVNATNDPEMDYFFNSIPEQQIKINALNATSIGNIAYIILHHREMEVKILAQVALERIKDHYAIT